MITCFYNTYFNTAKLARLQDQTPVLTPPELIQDTALPLNAMKSLFPVDFTIADIHKFLLSLPPGELLQTELQNIFQGYFYSNLL